MLILMDLVVTVQERVCAEENNGAILFHPVEDPCPAQCSRQIHTTSTCTACGGCALGALPRVLNSN